MAKKPLRLNEWLTLAEVESALPAMRHFDAARVARGDQQSTQTGDGFLPNYRKARGSKARMKKRQARTNETWFERRNNFVKRHMAQARKNREKLFRNSIPSKRMLGLIAWAYVPPEWDDAYTEWVEAGWPVTTQSRRNTATEEVLWHGSPKAGIKGFTTQRRRTFGKDEQDVGLFLSKDKKFAARLCRARSASYFVSGNNPKQSKALASRPLHGRPRE